MSHMKTWNIRRIGILSVLAAAGLLLALQTSAQVSLAITNLNVTTTDEIATISWNTNFATGARLDFGADETYGYYLISGESPRTDHSFTIGNLTPEKTYHFKVTSDGGGQTISTFDRTFKTKKGVDNDGPVIANVKVVYITGTAATIQWETDEPSSTGVRYGTTEKYTRTVGGRGNVKLHEITLRGLKIGALYHFQAFSTDKDKNTATWHDKTFSTLLNGEADKVPLEISQVTPLTQNDPGLSADTAVVAWRTNKPATTVVRYGTSTRPNKSQTVAGLSDFEHSVRIASLTPNTTYYFIVESKDVFGKGLKSELLSFKTKAVPKPSPYLAVRSGDNPRVLGFSTLDLTRPKALYRVAGTKDVYAIFGQQKYRLVNPEALRRYSYTGILVKDVSQAALDQYSLVRLVKASDAQTVYYLSRRPDGRILKLAIPSPSVFASYPRNKWDKVVTLDAADIAGYETAKLIRAESTTAIYLLEGGQKRLITETQLLQRGFKTTDIVTVSPEHLQSIQTGSDV